MPARSRQAGGSDSSAMAGLRALLNSRPLLWLLLALPAAWLVRLYFRDGLWPDEMVGPTGEWAARLIILALMLTPLSMLLPRARAIGWLVRRRRAFGVGAFAYALLHLAFYVAEMETLENMLAELGALGIWTGWAALALVLPLALTSNNAAMRALKSGWKKLQRLAYPAALLTLVHWIAVHDALTQALIQFAPLALLELYRLVRFARSRGGARRQDPEHST
jgi:sulfoxide reductase heme-binding subunit YedZ